MSFCHNERVYFSFFYRLTTLKCLDLFVNQLLYIDNYQRTKEDFVGVIGTERIHNFWVARAQFRKTRKRKPSTFDPLLSVVPSLPVTEMSKLGIFLGNELTGMMDDMDYNYPQRVVEIDQVRILEHEQETKVFCSLYGVNDSSLTNVVWNDTWIHCSMIGIKTRKNRRNKDVFSFPSLFGMFNKVEETEQLKGNGIFREEDPVVCFLVRRQPKILSDGILQTIRRPDDTFRLPAMKVALKKIKVEGKYINLLIILLDRIT